MTHREERENFILRVNRGEVTLTDEQVKNEFHAFVRAVARRKQNQGLTMDELIEAGNRGLLEAWHTFDPTKGIRFVPWAVYFIRTAMEEETLLFHAREMEKILRKQMPKGWSIRCNMELMDETGEKFCGAECASRSGLNGQIGTSASVILTELLDKHNINYHIQNTTHHE